MQSNKMMGKHSTRNFSITSLACTANRPRAPLFEAILRCAWDDIRTFILMGRWESGCDYGDSTLLPKFQAQKWATYFDSYSDERKRQLPLHAALNFLAPLSIIQLLVDLYPEAVKYPDNQGNLPLHIAFMTNASDASSYLLKIYPEALMIYNEKGNLPVECSHYNYNTMSAALAESPMEIEETKARQELLLLEQEIAKDEHKMSAAESELIDIKEGLRRIRSEGLRRLMTSSDHAFVTDTIQF